MTPHSRTGWLLPLLLSSLLWVPGVGLAAQDAPLASARLALRGPLADSESSPDRDEQSWHEAERHRAPLGLRLLTEVGAGTVTAVGGFFAGGLLGALVCLPTGLGSAPYIGCVGTALVGGVLGLAEGYALGVWWGGEAMGGDGSLLLSLLGGTLGMLVSLALLPASYQNEVIAYSLPLPPMLGSHLGYELSQRPTPPSGALSSRPGVQPRVSFSSRGALLGLGGRF